MDFIDARKEVQSQVPIMHEGDQYRKNGRICSEITHERKVKQKSSLMP
jgi:hypothetical protein